MIQLSRVEATLEKSGWTYYATATVPEKYIAYKLLKVFSGVVTVETGGRLLSFLSVPTNYASMKDWASDGSIIPRAMFYLMGKKYEGEGGALRVNIDPKIVEDWESKNLIKGCSKKMTLIRKYNRYHFVRISEEIVKIFGLDSMRQVQLKEWLDGVLLGAKEEHWKAYDLSWDHYCALLKIVSVLMKEQEQDPIVEDPVSKL